jgi:hypothetical protein
MPVNGDLPDPSLITEPVKVAEMICISSQGLCGEDDFGFRGWWHARLSAKKRVIHQVEKSRYALASESFQSLDKFLRIAVNDMLPIKNRGRAL